MKRLNVTKVKPNPSGRDRLGNYVPFSQLAGEWVDFKNIGDESFSLNSIELQHVAYTPPYPNGVWEKVMGFSGNLGVGRIVRVHSGGEIPIESLSPEDFIFRIQLYQEALQANLSLGQEQFHLLDS